jgi:hypothetical protein
MLVVIKACWKSGQQVSWESYNLINYKIFLSKTAVNNLYTRLEQIQPSHVGYQLRGRYAYKWELLIRCKGTAKTISPPTLIDILRSSAEP